MIVAKFGSNCFSGFRKSLDRRRRTPSDSNSSHGLLARWAKNGRICVSIEHACLPPFPAKHEHRSETMWIVPKRHCV